MAKSVMDTHICRICENTEHNTTYEVREMMLGLRDMHTYFECANCGCLQIANVPENIQEVGITHLVPMYRINRRWKVVDFTTKEYGVHPDWGLDIYLWWMNVNFFHIDRVFAFNGFHQDAQMFILIFQKEIVEKFEENWKLIDLDLFEILGLNKESVPSDETLTSSEEATGGI